MKKGRGNPIPQASRLLVETREIGRCLRCGMRGSDWHHRRKRSVKDEHQHCACNGVLLCRTCHTWAHAYPLEAKAKGYIVSQFQPSPGLTQVDAWHGAVTLWCDGSYGIYSPL